MGGSIGVVRRGVDCAGARSMEAVTPGRHRWAGAAGTSKTTARQRQHRRRPRRRPPATVRPSLGQPLRLAKKKARRSSLGVNTGSARATDTRSTSSSRRVPANWASARSSGHAHDDHRGHSRSSYGPSSNVHSNLNPDLPIAARTFATSAASPTDPCQRASPPRPASWTPGLRSRADGPRRPGCRTAAAAAASGARAAPRGRTPRPHRAPQAHACAPSTRADGTKDRSPAPRANRSNCRRSSPQATRRCTLVILNGVVSTVSLMLPGSRPPCPAESRMTFRRARSWRTRTIAHRCKRTRRRAHTPGMTVRLSWRRSLVGLNEHKQPRSSHPGT